jgi:hypothetical protein
MRGDWRRHLQCSLTIDREAHAIPERVRTIEAFILEQSGNIPSHGELTNLLYDIALGTKVGARDPARRADGHPGPPAR